MKSKRPNHYRKINRAKYSLGELVSIISSVTGDAKEATAAMIDMLHSGRVCVREGKKLKRVKVCHC